MVKVRLVGLLEKIKLERLSMISLFGLFSIICSLMVKGDFHIYSQLYGLSYDYSKLNSILNALIQSNAAVLAIVFALTVLAIQISAQTYSPRVIVLHAGSIYFIAPFFFFLFTLIYLIVLFGKIKSLFEKNMFLAVDLGILFSIFSLSLLFPLAYRTINLLRPNKMIFALMEKIKPSDFAQYYSFPNNLMNKLQPVVDTIISAINKGDKQTAIDGLRIIERKCIKFIKQDPRDELISGMIVILGKAFLDLCLYSNQVEDIVISGHVIHTIRNITIKIIECPVREPVYGFLEILNKIDNNAKERFSESLYQEQLLDFKEMIADCRLKILEVYH